MTKEQEMMFEKEIYKGIKNDYKETKRRVTRTV